MPPGFQLGVEQAAIHLNFKSAAIGRHQVDSLYLGFETAQQLLYQANGPVGVMSDSTIGDINFEQHGHILMVVDWLKIIT
jgi:hypothetical protein